MSASGLPGLRRDFRRYCVANDNKAVQPLRNVMMVGAIPDHERVIDTTDWSYLRKTFEKLQSLSVPVARDFNVEIVNIDRNCGGRDFLKESAPADIVVLCFLFNPSAESTRALGRSTGGIYAISENHYERQAWHDSALRVGAKVISVYGQDGGTEVGPEVFLRHPAESQFDMRASGGFFDPFILFRKGLQLGA